MMRPDCSVPIEMARRRAFWATQPNACPDVDGLCGVPCGRPGFEFIDTDEGRTIANTDWLRSLFLNMLMTDARVQNSLCGVNPAAVKGHWSDSYRSDGLQAGSRIRQIDFSKLGINESVSQVNAYLTADAQKLVRLGVAQDIKVTTTYLGSYRIGAEIVPYSALGAPMGNVALLGQRTRTNWIWS